MTRRVSALAIALCLIAPCARAQGQVMVPLADVARQAEAARVTAKKAKKVYTNANLSSDPRGEAPAPVAAGAIPAGSVSKSADTLTAENTASLDATANGATVLKESEEEWRLRATSLRSQTDRLRERLAELAVPNALTDESPILKQANAKDIATTRRALDGLRKQWAQFEASANQRQIPVAWVQPPPVFPQ